MQPNRYRSTRWACYRGYIVEAILNNLAPLLFVIFQTNYGIDFEGLSWLLFITFLTQLAVDALAAGYVNRIGYRAAIVLAHFLSAAGLADVRRGVCGDCNFRDLILIRQRTH